MRHVSLTPLPTLAGVIVDAESLLPVAAASMFLRVVIEFAAIAAVVISTFLMTYCHLLLPRLVLVLPLLVIASLALSVVLK